MDYSSPKALNLEESAWARARSDLHGLVTNTVKFTVIVAVFNVSLVALTDHLAWGHSKGAQIMIDASALLAGVILSFLVPLIAFALTAPVRQRDEARAVLLYRAPFPNLKIEALSLQRRDTPNYSRWVVTPIRITNREQTRVNLELVPRVELVKFPGEALRLLPEDRIEFRGGISLKSQIQPPIHVEPLSTINFDYGIVWTTADEAKFADPQNDAASRSPFEGRGDRLRLDVYDHISGQTISMYLPGVYETRGMVPG